MSSDNYYQLLSLRPSASFVDIKKRYRQLSLRFHPDHGGTTLQMVKLNEAYCVLSNPFTRREYDSRYMQAEQDERMGSIYRRGSHADIENEDAQRDMSVQSKPRSYFWRWFSIVLVVSVGFLVYEIKVSLQTSSMSEPSTVPQQRSTVNTQTSDVGSGDNLPSSSGSLASNPQTGTSNTIRQWRKHRNQE